MGYVPNDGAAADDGDPQQAAEIHSQATEDVDMSEVNESSVGSVQTVAASDNGPTSAPDDTLVPSGPPAGATKNVSFNLVPSSSSGHSNDCDCDSEDDDEESSSGDGTSSVRVAVRIRPFLPSETGTSGVIDVLPVTANNAASGHKRRRPAATAVPTSLQIGGPAGVQFTYDAVHGTKSTQADLYLASVRPLVRQCLKGCEFKAVSGLGCDSIRHGDYATIDDVRSVLFYVVSLLVFYFGITSCSLLSLSLINP